MAQDYQETLLPRSETFAPQNGSPKWQEPPVKSTRLPEQNENIGGKNRGERANKNGKWLIKPTCITSTIRNQQGPQIKNRSMRIREWYTSITATAASTQLERANRARS
jgi:hypothetical protein